MRKDWKIDILKNLCDVFDDGNWIESKDQSPFGIRLIQTGNIGFGFFKDKEDKSRYISEETFERLKCTEIFPGDLLVSRLPDPVGKSCIIPDMNIKMITGVDCTIVRPKNYLKSEFLKYYQMSDSYLNDVRKRVTGTTRSRISRKNLGMIEIPLPPLVEQQKIVEKLDKAFELIDQAKANIEQNIINAKELFQSKLDEVFSQKGDGWEIVNLDSVACNLDSKRIPITKNKRESGEIPYYAASGIVDYVKDYIFDGDYLLVTEDGATLLARTYPIAFSVSGKFWVNNHAHILKFENSITQKYVEYFLNSIKLDDYISGMAQPKLNQAKLYKIPINIPISLDKQEEIIVVINFISDIKNELISKYQQKL